MFELCIINRELSVTCSLAVWSHSPLWSRIGCTLQSGLCILNFLGCCLFSSTFGKGNSTVGALGSRMSYQSWNYQIKVTVCDNWFSYRSWLQNIAGLIHFWKFAGLQRSNTASRTYQINMVSMFCLKPGKQAVLVFCVQYTSRVLIWDNKLT